MYKFLSTNFKRTSIKKEYIIYSYDEFKNNSNKCSGRLEILHTEVKIQSKKNMFYGRVLPLYFWNIIENTFRIRQMCVSTDASSTRAPQSQIQLFSLLYCNESYTSICLNKITIDCVNCIKESIIDTYIYFFNFRFFVITYFYYLFYDQRYL